MKTKRIINFSGGLCSFWAAHRVINQYGRDDVTLLFADVLTEDADLYRFNQEAAALLGVPITRISLGKTPWDVFFQEGMIGNSRAPICSMRLKREILDEWTRANCLEFNTVLYFGIDWTESHRLEGLRKRYPTWRCEAPMCEAPFWDKCRMIEECRSLGLEPPRMYAAGYAHNNCAGACVTAGQAQWALVLKNDRNLYLDNENKENQFRATHGDFSILKDRRGGASKPMSLTVFRERVEAGENFDRHDWGGCGCSVQVT